MSVNAFYVSGRLVRDVHSGENGGVPFSLYTIAENYAYTDRAGKRQHGTNYVPVVSYGAQAEADARYLKKGRAVAVTGRIVSWFKRAEKRGGLTLRITSVDYVDGMARSGAAIGATDSGGDEAHEAWVRDYCAGEMEWPDAPSARRREAIRPTNGSNPESNARHRPSRGSVK